MSHKIIQQLLAIHGLKVECPNPRCQDKFPLSRAKLFSMYDMYLPAVQRIFR